MDEKPEVMEKIIPIWGDITQVNLGISDVQLDYLINNTQIIFHLAASLKLEATLKPNVLMNLTATKYVLDIAKQMKNLLQMIHTSTAFCNVEQSTLEEKVYESEHNPMDFIKCAEWMTEEAMACTQLKVLDKHINTYTFTKLLAEILVRDEFKQNNIPVCIVRPSIVTPSLKEPLPGWVDSLNGPSGIIVAGARGVLRCMLLDKEANFEAIPVDMAINAMITVVKEHSTASTKPNEVPVYNVTVHKSNRITYGDLFDVVESVRYEMPLSFGLWYPKVTITTNKYYFTVFTFLFQWLPAYFIDFLLMIFGQKRL
jgi:alcohol-forming fatty acyl-CoA reductase